MSDWLRDVRTVLDKAEQPVSVFFRDDDAGWSNDKLYELLDEFGRFGMPIDLAVIPQNLDTNLAGELLCRRCQTKPLLGLHQHGYSHANHEPLGRKCEFGPTRSKIQQKNDIEKGRHLLREALGKALDPFFTPPWNRCTQTTIECLAELNFKLLSRDATAVKLEPLTLKQTPVHIDWSRMLNISLSELGRAIAINLAQNALTGSMLHHADRSRINLIPLAELLALFSQHNNVQGLLLRNTCVNGMERQRETQL
jgi:hypothetical protein